MEVLIDYLSFSDKANGAEYWVERLGLKSLHWEIGGNRHRWTGHLYSSGIHVYENDEGLCGLEFSGVGCRTLESLNNLKFDWFKLISDIILLGSCNISRLDVAGDETEGILNFDNLYRYIKARKYITRSRRVFWSDGDEQQIVFGSPQSDTRLRIYNKALERDIPDKHWTRCEMQLRNDEARSFCLNWIEQEGNLGVTYGGVLLHYLRFHLTSARCE